MFPAALQGSIDSRLYYVADWFLTMLSAAGVPSALAQPHQGAEALDGHDMWCSAHCFSALYVGQK